MQMASNGTAGAIGPSPSSPMRSLGPIGRVRVSSACERAQAAPLKAQRVKMRKPERPKMGHIYRCAIYTRKSSDDGLEQEFNSLDAQREACEAYGTSQRHAGWIALPAIYDDGGLSGGTMERPGSAAAPHRLLSAPFLSRAATRPPTRRFGTTAHQCVWGDKCCSINRDIRASRRWPVASKPGDST
jgi:hypothetical protein